MNVSVTGIPEFSKDVNSQKQVNSQDKIILKNVIQGAQYGIFIPYHYKYYLAEKLCMHSRMVFAESGCMSDKQLGMAAMVCVAEKAASTGAVSPPVPALHCDALSRFAASSKETSHESDR